MENINCWESKFQPCQYSDKLIKLIILLNESIVFNPRLSSILELVNIEVVKKACYYARVYHGDQKNESEEPYYSNPLIVAYLFALHVGHKKRSYYRTELIVIAILQDTLKDTKLTYKMIVEIFGKIVADGVQDLTRLSGEIKIRDDETLDHLLKRLDQEFSQYKHEILYIKTIRSYICSI
jgi:(p)ppGpp synthase/HD superfamily hydrolase